MSWNCYFTRIMICDKDLYGGNVWSHQALVAFQYIPMVLIISLMWIDEVRRYKGTPFLHSNITL